VQYKSLKAKLTRYPCNIFISPLIYPKIFYSPGDKKEKNKKREKNNY